jgi:PAS domain S-box-containing protein
MSTPTITEALDSWRAAERRRDATEPGDPTFRTASIDLISAWLDYQAATNGFQPGCFVVVADDEHRYVAVSGDVKAVLGYEPKDLIGRRAEEIAAPDLLGSTPTDWQRLVADGRQEGVYRVLGYDGREVAVRFTARADYPIQGYHLSRAWRMEATIEADSQTAMLGRAST